MPIAVRRAERRDAPELADLLNVIIARGGTTALQDPYRAEDLARAYLVGPDVICCFVAVDPETETLLGFQTLGPDPALPDGWGDIGTFARVGGTQRGVGSALFAATREEACRQGLKGINATIRADNAGGLAFYGSMGFQDHAVARDVPLKDGTPVDRISKRYWLAPGD